MAIELAFCESPPEGHPWRAVHDRRQAALDKWNAGDAQAALQELLQLTQEAPDYPYAWSACHRLGHWISPGETHPLGEKVVHVNDIPGCRVFSFYRFFGRCYSARIVGDDGWNSFEFPCPEVCTRWLSHVGGTFCDLGANSGYYTILALAAGVKSAVAFDPYPPAVDVLRSNIELNGWDNRCAVMQAGVSDRNAIVPFYLPQLTNGWLATSSSLDPSFSPEHSIVYHARVITLDECLTGPAAVGPLTLKIDIEGTEPTLAALAGAAGQIRARRPVIMLEHAQGPSDRLNRFLAEHGYVDYIFRPDATWTCEPTVIVYPDQINHFFVPREIAPQFIGRVANEI